MEIKIYEQLICACSEINSVSVVVKCVCRGVVVVFIVMAVPQVI